MCHKTGIRIYHYFNLLDFGSRIRSIPKVGLVSEPTIVAATATIIIESTMYVISSSSRLNDICSISSYNYIVTTLSIHPCTTIITFKDVSKICTPKINNFSTSITTNRWLNIIHIALHPRSKLNMLNSIENIFFFICSSSGVFHCNLIDSRRTSSCKASKQRTS